jgi:hypothetical protein
VRGAEDVAPDAPETVDPDLHCHEASLPLIRLDEPILRIRRMLVA